MPDNHLARLDALSVDLAFIYAISLYIRTLKALAHKHVCAFVVLRCDKYQNCTCLLNYFSMYGNACPHMEAHVLMSISQ